MGSSKRIATTVLFLRLRGRWFGLPPTRLCFAENAAAEHKAELEERTLDGAACRDDGGEGCAAMKRLLAGELSEDDLVHMECW